VSLLDTRAAGTVVTMTPPQKFGESIGAGSVGQG